MADDAVPSGSVGAHVKANTIMSDDVDKAVAAYLEKPSPGPVALGSDYAIDVADAIEAHAASKRILADEGTRDGLRRMMVRTAVLLARPVKA